DSPHAAIRTRPYLPLDDLALLFKRLVGGSTRPPPFARIGPVHFQPLEWELAPVAGYLNGRLLNAGCGNRDITPFALENGVSEVIDYDISSDLPRAVIGPLEDLPFFDAEFDSILCNAVLEHVRSPDPIMRQMCRVLRPGGHLIVSVPFLQPFHPCPG